MRRLLIVLLFAVPAAADETLRPVPYCTDVHGDRIELGGLTCIAASCVPAYLARCEMSLNSPMWRKVQDGCPAVSLTPGVVTGSRPPVAPAPPASVRSASG